MGRVGSAPSVTARSLLIGLLLIPVNAYWLVQMEQSRYSAHPTTVSLFFNAVFILLAVTLVNALVGRVLPRAALRRGELLAIYAMIAVASALPAHDLQQILVPMLVWPYRFLEQNKQWAVFIPFLPRDWMVSDPSVYMPFFQGNASLYTPYILRAWLWPVIVWTVVLAALLLVMLCVNAILRKP